MIGKLLSAGVLAAGVGYLYPLWNEQAPSACRALEQRFLSMAAPAGDAPDPAPRIGARGRADLARAAVAGPHRRLRGQA